LESMSLPVEAVPSAIGALASIDARLRHRLFVSGVPRAPKPADGDRLVDVKETAALLKHSTTWVYRNQCHLPRVDLPGGSLRFSAAGLQELLEARRA